jgi:hypothetical protein
MQAIEELLLRLRRKPVEAWFACQSPFLLLWRQVSMPLQPRAEMRLLITFKPRVGNLRSRPSEARSWSGRQGKHEEQRRIDTTSKLPAVEAPLDIFARCHGGSLQMGLR